MTVTATAPRTILEPTVLRRQTCGLEWGESPGRPSGQGTSQKVSVSGRRVHSALLSSLTDVTGQKGRNLPKPLRG